MQKIKEFITIRNIIIVISVCVCLISAGILLHKYISEKNAQNKFDSLSTVNTENIEIETEEETIFTYLGIEDPGKVLDWEYLWEQNEDIYAWLYIPGTSIDYPILQHETDNTYYLEYNLDGSKGRPGCIYTENLNTKDFSDYNTLIYGHNMRNGTMFHDLHNFEEKEFFEANRYVFIYTPEKLYIYDIFAAYKFTDVHILYGYDCFTQQGFRNYLDMVFEDYADAGYFREGVEVTSEDHIITLSTCVSGESEKRYLVQGVLVEYDGGTTAGETNTQMDVEEETEE